MPDEYEFSRHLGDAVKVARDKAGLTQNELAARLGIDERTILNIENYRGNPRLEVLYPLVRELKIDPNLIFFSELHSPKSLMQHQFQVQASQCSDEEAAALHKICETILAVLRSKNCIEL